jgi:hypothetical protein
MISTTFRIQIAAISLHRGNLHETVKTEQSYAHEALDLVSDMSLETALAMNKAFS